MPSVVLTVILPVVPAAGAVTVSEVAVALLTVAATPLNFTVLSVGVVLKLVPVIVTTVFTGPIAGLMDATVGGNGIVTGALFLQAVKANPVIISVKMNVFIL